MKQETVSKMERRQLLKLLLAIYGVPRKQPATEQRGPVLQMVLQRKGA